MANSSSPLPSDKIHRSSRFDRTLNGSLNAGFKNTVTTLSGGGNFTKKGTGTLTMTSPTSPKASPTSIHTVSLSTNALPSLLEL